MQLIFINKFLYPGLGNKHLSFMRSNKLIIGQSSNISLRRSVLVLVLLIYMFSHFVNIIKFFVIDLADRMVMQMIVSIF